MPVLTAATVRKSYRRGVWPLRRRRQVLRGADLTLAAQPSLLSRLLPGYGGSRVLLDGALTPG